MKLIEKTGPAAIILLSVIPIVLWLPNADFSNYAKVFLGLGQVSALVGFCLYSLNFVISARLKITEPFFAGLPRAYVWHHLFGAGAFVLLLYHPLLISVSYLAISVQAAADLLWPNIQNLPVYLGILALLAMIVLLVLTLYVKLEYDFWKKTHQYLGLAFILASLHVFLIGSTLDQSPALKTYLLILAGTALASYAYRTLLGRWLVPKKAYTVAEVKKLAKDVLEISLTPDKSGGIKFAPGQFIFIQPNARGIARQFHPFSLTCPEGSMTLAVGIKAVGDFTETLKLLQPGASVLVEGAFGRFSYKFYPYPKQVWIAGGIGVTPFVSLARSLPAGKNWEVDFYYSVKDAGEAVYAKDFEEIVRTNPDFHFHLHKSKDKGRLTADIISSDVNDLLDREIFVCGPPPMMKSIREQLRAKGVRNSHIHSEEFALS